MNDSIVEYVLTLQADVAREVPVAVILYRNGEIRSCYLFSITGEGAG